MKQKLKEKFDTFGRRSSNLDAEVSKILLNFIATLYSLIFTLRVSSRNLRFIFQSFN